MQVGLGSLIHAEVAAYVAENRAFYAARAASGGTDSRPDLRTAEGLQEARALEEARARRSVSATSPGPRPVEALAEVGGRRVPETADVRSARTHSESSSSCSVVQLLTSLPSGP